MTDLMSEQKALGATRNPCYTEPVANLTITVDEEVLRRARIRALELNTSVNAVLRQYLDEFIAGSHDNYIMAAFLKLTGDESTGAASTGLSWSRDDLYQERTKWPRS